MPKRSEYHNVYRNHNNGQNRPKTGQKVYINISQSGIVKVGSDTSEPQNLPAMMGRFIRCIFRLSKANSLPIGFGKCTKDAGYQGITSRDVFADYQAFSSRQTGDETTLQKLAVVVAFGSGILVICFSVFLFSWNAENYLPDKNTRAGLRVQTGIKYRHSMHLAQVRLEAFTRIGAWTTAQIYPFLGSWDYRTGGLQCLI